VIAKQSLCVIFAPLGLCVMLFSFMAGLLEKSGRGALVWQGGKSLGFAILGQVLMKIPIHHCVGKKSAGRGCRKVLNISQLEQGEKLG